MPGRPRPARLPSPGVCRHRWRCLPHSPAPPAAFGALSVSLICPELSPHERVPRDGAAVLAKVGFLASSCDCGVMGLVLVDTNTGEYFHLVRVSLFQRATLGGPTRFSGDISIT